MVALSAVLGRQFKGSGIVGFGLLPFIGQSGQRRGWEASPWRSYFFRDKANFGSCYRFAGKIRCREITGWRTVAESLFCRFPAVGTKSCVGRTYCCRGHFPESTYSRRSGGIGTASAHCAERRYLTVQCGGCPLG